MKDFTLIQYQNLLTTLKLKGYQIQANTVVKESPQKTIILRHDIDALPLKAISMAIVENKMGVASSFFFKIHPDIFIPQIIQEVASLDHKIGYHYEDLARNHGNYAKAISDFERHLDLMREIVPVNTICADGNPLSKYNNLWLWDKYDYRQFGIECEMYLDIDYNETAYFTDTGRCWDGDKFNVWDHVKTDKPWPRFHTTAAIIHAIGNDTFPVIAAFNIHPQRWQDTIYGWSKELVMQNVKNQVKYLLLKRGG